MKQSKRKDQAALLERRATMISTEEASRSTAQSMLRDTARCCEVPLDAECHAAESAQLNFYILENWRDGLRAVSVRTFTSQLIGRDGKLLAFILESARAHATHPYRSLLQFQARFAAPKRTQVRRCRDMVKSPR